MIISSYSENSLKLFDLVNRFSYIFPNLKFCSLENVINESYLRIDLIKESISCAKSKFSSYTGRLQVDIRWNNNAEFYPDRNSNDDIDLLEKICAEIKDFPSNYIYDKDKRTHEWREELFLAPKVSFESIIRITE